MNAFLRVALLVVRKDLMVEARSFELVTTTLFFAVTVVLVFAFGLVREGRAVDDVAAAVLWIAMAFSGTLALGRTFERERQADTLRALMLAPADRPALYAGKLAGILLLMALVEAVLVPMVGLMFQAPIFVAPGWLAGLLAAGTLGFAAVGTLFAAMLVRARTSIAANSVPTAANPVVPATRSAISIPGNWKTGAWNHRPTSGTSTSSTRPSSSSIPASLPA